MTQDIGTTLVNDVFFTDGLVLGSSRIVRSGSIRTMCRIFKTGRFF